MLQVLLLGSLLPVKAQNAVLCTAGQLDSLILNNTKPYKILYVYCTYCKPAQYNKTLDSLIVAHNSDSIAFFPVTYESWNDVAPYLVKHKMENRVYMLQSEKKNKRFLFVTVGPNPVAEAADYLLKFDSSAVNVGLGGYVILDRNNRPILHSDYKISYPVQKKTGVDPDYMALLDFIRRH